MYCLLFILAAASLLDAKHLPSYIKPCRKDDPDFRACSKQHAIDAIPHLVKGIKEFKIAPLSPFHIPLITIKAGEHLSLKLKDANLFGLETAIVQDIYFDLQKKHVIVKLTFPRINILGEYEIDGQILVVPIKGSGPANITSENLVLDYTFDYDLITKDDGKQYFDPNIRPTVEYSVEKNHYYFGNLFNGDKLLGDRTNEFLNEHQKELHEDLKGSFQEAINAIVSSLLKSIISSIPYDEIFL